VTVVEFNSSFFYLIEAFSLAHSASPAQLQLQLSIFSFHFKLPFQADSVCTYCFFGLKTLPLFCLGSFVARFDLPGKLTALKTTSPLSLFSVSSFST